MSRDACIADTCCTRMLKFNRAFDTFTRLLPRESMLLDTFPSVLSSRMRYFKIIEIGCDKKIFATME